MYVYFEWSPQHLKTPTNRQQNAVVCDLRYPLPRYSRQSAKECPKQARYFQSPPRGHSSTMPRSLLPLTRGNVDISTECKASDWSRGIDEKVRTSLPLPWESIKNV